MRLFAISLAFGAFQILAARALGVALFDSWLVLLASSAAAQAGFGLGAAIVGPARAPNRRWLLFAGASILFFQAAALTLRPPAAPLTRAALAAAAALLAFTGAGATHAVAFTALRAARGAARATAVSLAGLAAGLLLGGRLALWPGVHASTSGLALGLAASGAGAPAGAALALVAAPAVWPGFDDKIERLRGAELDCNWRCSAAILKRRYTSLYSRWSPYSRVDIYRHSASRSMFGAYNYRVHWKWFAHYPPATWGAFVRPTDHVLIIGSSAGFDARLVPSTATLPNTTFVEIDPVMGEIFRSSPSLNGGFYDHGRLEVADGRHVLDRAARRWDAMLMGSAESPSRGVGRLTETRNSLFTREGVARALDSLTDEGVALYFPREDVAARAVASSLESLGAPWFVHYVNVTPVSYKPPTPDAPMGYTWFHDGRIIQYDLFTARSPAALERAFRSVTKAHEAKRRRPGEGLTRATRSLTSSIQRRSFILRREEALRVLWPSGLEAPPADWRPFLSGQDPALRPLLSLSGLLASLIVLICCAACAARPGVPAYFTAIGTGFALAMTGLAAAWRSALGDPLLTALVVTLCWIAGASLGALASRSRRLLTGSRRWEAAAALGAGLGLAAFAAPSGWHPAAAMLLCVVVVTPVAALAGVYFPAGLDAVPADATPAALAWDGLGAAAALPLFAALSLWPEGGIGACLAAAAALYFAAAAASRRLYQ